MFLPLAERMVEKMVKEDKIEAEAEVSNLSVRPESCHVISSKLEVFNGQEKHNTVVYFQLQQADKCELILNITFMCHCRCSCILWF